jgi:membrane associated rhomboid family serine protease
MLSVEAEKPHGTAQLNIKIPDDILAKIPHFFNPYPVILMQAVRGFFDSLHFGTRFLTISMIVIYIIQFCLIDGNMTSWLSFWPRAIVERGQLWRLITATYMHLGIFHLAMNMMSFTFTAISLEGAIGTLSFLYHIVIFGIISDIVHIVIAYILLLGGDPTTVDSQAMGFSGVLFALIVIDINLSGGEQRSIFGLFLVPSWTYPWVMLLVMSLMLQGVSFLGHLSGLITGYLYQWGVLSYLAPPSEFFGRVERKICCCCVNRLGYLTTDGRRQGEYQPYAFFQRVFRDEEEDPRPQAPRFEGHGRTVGQLPPVDDPDIRIDASDHA